MRTLLASTSALVAALSVLAAPAVAGTITTDNTTTAGSPHNFGSYLVNSGNAAPTFAIHFTNTGAGARSVSSTTNSATTGSTLTNSGAAVLASGSPTPTTGTLTYTFKPTTTGVKTFNTTLSATGTPAFSQSVYGQVTGVAPLAVSGVNTAYSLVGETAAHTASGSVTVTNTGDATTALGADNTTTFTAGTATGLHITGVTNTPGTATTAQPSFTITTTPLPTTLSNKVLQDGQTATYAYSVGIASGGLNGLTRGVVKSASSAQSAKVTIANGLNSSNIGGTLTITPTVTGVAPLESASTTNAGYTLVGTSKNATVTVTNTGNGNLAGADTGGAGTTANGGATNLRLGAESVPAGTVNNPQPFSIVGGSQAYSLPDGASQVINVKFAPTVTGMRSTTVSGTFSNGISNTNSSGIVALGLPVTGQGVAPVVGQYGATSAGYVRIGTTGQGTFYIQNVGNGNLSGAGLVSNLRGNAVKANDNLNLFQITAPTAINVNDSGTQTFTYTFTPTSGGSFAAQAVLNLDNGDVSGQNLASGVNTPNGVTNTPQVGLGGTGVGPEFSSDYGSDPVAANNTTIDFGSVLSGQTATRTITLSNIATDLSLGSFLQTLSIFTTSGVAGGNAHFTIDPFNTTGLNPGQSLTLTLHFTGILPGSYNDVLVIHTDQDAAYGMEGDLFRFNLAGTVFVPEPGSMMLLSVGLGGLVFIRRRRANPARLA